ncbi:MAG TPA: hypothetical protein VNB90_12715 [Cytophagaceae bacterium]|nr:hypothetical protein [Cytophagaceae bacterium]
MKNKKEVLAEAILLLENKQALQLKDLKQQFQETYESLKPINLIKNTFHEVDTSPDLKKDILNTAVGVATGLVTKGFMAPGQVPIKKMLGTLFQFAVAKLVSSNSEKIINSSESIFQKIMNARKNNPKQEFSKN